MILGSFPGDVVVKNLPATAGDTGDVGSIRKSIRSPGEGNGNPLQCSCLENRVVSEAWWATVPGVTKSQTWLSIYIVTILQHPLWCKQFSKLPKARHLFEFKIHTFQLRTSRASSQECTGCILIFSNSPSSLPHHPPLLPFLPKCQDIGGFISSEKKGKK